MSNRIIQAAIVGMSFLSGTMKSEAASTLQGVPGIKRLQMRSTTDAYNDAAFKVLLEEVNQIARDLKLPETLPIRAELVTEKTISSPFMSERAGTFGTISTSNYHYYASQGNKLSYIERNFGRSNLQKPGFYDLLKKRYTLPKSQIDTNGAYASAVGWLSAFGVDVKAVERDSKIEIITWDLGTQFVPVYYVGWRKGGATSALNSDDDSWTVAMVEFFEPDHLLLQMHVENPKYIKRKPLAVPNREILLQKADDSKDRALWSTTDAYKKAALEIMLREVNRLCQELDLPERLPIRASDLTKVMIETPYVADQLGRFATIHTKDFIYGAIHGNKLSYINKSVQFKGEEERYLNSLKARYGAAEYQTNTNSAYVLATQWLAAASVDLKALERGCKVVIQPRVLGGRALPLYSVVWVEEDRNRTRATVEVLVPARSLEKLWVEKPEYITRDPLVVPNREELMRRTNTVVP